MVTGWTMLVYGYLTGFVVGTVLLMVYSYYKLNKENVQMLEVKEK